MEDNHYPPQAGRNQPVAFIAQLMQRLPTLHNVDEALQYMADAMVHQFDLLAVQLYMLQKGTNGHLQTYLRTSACSYLLDSSLLTSPWLTVRITQTIARLPPQQQNLTSLPIERLFSSPQTSLLHQQHIRFWSAYLLNNSIPLPSPTTPPSPTPPTMLISLLTSHPLSTDLARAITFVTEQSLRVIDHSNFPSSSPTVQQPATQPSFSTIIARRTQQVEQFQAANPFASAPIINNKQARQIYSTIDGHRNLSEIARITNFDLQTLLKYLYDLYQQKYIQLFTPQGNPVEPSSLFPKMK